MGSAPFAQEAGRFFIILFANVPMGVCGFGDAIVMHMALTLCGMVRGWEGGRGWCIWLGREGRKDESLLGIFRRAVRLALDIDSGEARDGTKCCCVVFHLHHLYARRPVWAFWSHRLSADR